jgi:hypothetical protein
VIRINKWLYNPHLSGENQSQRMTNYFIAIYTIALISPFFSLLQKAMVLFFLVFLVLIAFKRGVKLLEVKIFVLLLFVYFLIFIQNVLYSGMSYASLYLPLSIFYIPYLIYRILGIRFLLYLQQVIFVSALYTFPLWLMQSLFPTVDAFLQSLIVQVLPYSWSVVPRSLLFYTAAWGEGVFNTTLGIYRNSGVFHEPGAYGVFLIMAIVTNTSFSKKLYSKRNLFLILVLLTTLSTTAYIVLFIVILSDLITKKINPALKVVSVLLFMFGAIQVYQLGDFLQEKVNNQLEDQIQAAEMNVGKTEAKSGRFYAFFTSLQLFSEHPVFGRGIAYSSSEKASGEMHKEGSFAYGITGIMSTYGIIFTLLFVVSFYAGMKSVGSVSELPGLMQGMIFVAVNLSILTQVFILAVPFVFLFIVGYLNEQKEISWFKKNMVL